MVTGWSDDAGLRRRLCVPLNSLEDPSADPEDAVCLRQDSKVETAFAESQRHETRYSSSLSSGCVDSSSRFAVLILPPFAQLRKEATDDDTTK